MGVDTVRPTRVPAGLKLCALLALVSIAILWSETGRASATQTPGLRSYAQAHGIEAGAAVRPVPLANEPLYAQTLAHEFSLLTPENAMKWDALRPAEDSYNFATADAIVDFAENEEMAVFGTTLVWHHQLPGWLVDGDFTREELIAILQDHIMTVVGHYQGRVYAWNVVNEAVADDGSLRDTFWLQGIGPEYIEMAFQWAHQADPDALLFYNDYGGEGLGMKSDAIYALVGDLVQSGVPLHGVGLQMHVSLGWSPQPDDVASNMERLANLGLEVQITEMDVRIQDGTGTTEERLAAQAQIYGEMMEVCLESAECTAFVTWGFTDLYTWIPDFTGQPDAPLLFDESYIPKPSYYAVRDALVALEKDPSGDTDGDTVPNGTDLEDDNDGCTDLAEFQPKANANTGGGRDPHYFWDFYDVWTHPVGDPEGWERNAAIDLFDDIFGVANRFGANDDNGNAPINRNSNPLVPPTDETGYHPAFDRGPLVGPNPWDLGPPDGAIDLFIDIFGVAAQFGHDCT